MNNEMEINYNIDENELKKFSKNQDLNVIDDIYKYNPWLKNADFSNAIIELDNDNNIIWKKGTWVNGIWEYGTWECGVWGKGKWKNGIWENGIWHDGLLYNGTWENGTWKNGTWFNGTWENGTWVKGEIWSVKQQRYIKSNVPPNEFYS